jgi:hypothetical protein
MQPLTVSTVQLMYALKEKGGKPDRKPYPLLYGLRNPHRTPYLELSRLCSDTSTKFYIYEFGFRFLTGRTHTVHTVLYCTY